MAGYICKIVIEDTHPPVWRRVVIPDKITFCVSMGGRSPA